MIVRTNGDCHITDWRSTDPPYFTDEQEAENVKWRLIPPNQFGEVYDLIPLPAKYHKRPHKDLYPHIISKEAAATGGAQAADKTKDTAAAAVTKKRPDTSSSSSSSSSSSKRAKTTKNKSASSSTAAAATHTYSGEDSEAAAAVTPYDWHGPLHGMQYNNLEMIKRGITMPCGHCVATTETPRRRAFDTVSTIHPCDVDTLLTLRRQRVNTVSRVSSRD